MIQEILRYFEQTPKSLVIAISLALLVIIGFLDLETGPQISFSIFYLIPIVLVSWCAGIAAGRWFSILGAIIWLAADLTSGQVYAQIWIPFWNMLVRLSFFIIVASTLASLKIKIEKETESARRDFLTGLANPRGFYENAEVELERLPISQPVEKICFRNKLQTRDWALAGGEDFELLFTTPREDVKNLRRLTARVGVPVTEIGVITANPGNIRFLQRGRPLRRFLGGRPAFRAKHGIEVLHARILVRVRNRPVRPENV